MSRSNTSIKHLLQHKYGKKCMFVEAHIEERLERIKEIKGYKKFLTEKHFTNKQKLKMLSSLTYHHLQHRSEGGHTTEENGALINGLAHAYIHTLPREHEEIINNMLREYKVNFGTISTDEEGNLTIEAQQHLFKFDDYITIPLKSNNELTLQEIQNKQAREEKRELQKLKKEFEDR